MRKNIFKIGIFALAFLLAGAQLALPVQGYTVRHAKQNLAQQRSPRTTNIFLKTPITLSEARTLAKWDIIVLGVQAQNVSPEAILLIRQLNPKAVILAYTLTMTAPFGFYKDLETKGAGVWHDLISQVGPENLLYNSAGELIEIWPGMPLFNWQSRLKGRPLPVTLARFWKEYALETGFWDGLYFDNTEGIISHVAKAADLNNDGLVESPSEIDSSWRQALSDLFTTLNYLVGDDFLLFGNGRGVKEYASLLDGAMLESFPNVYEGSAADSLNLANQIKFQLQAPGFIIVHSDTHNTGEIDKEFVGATFDMAQQIGAWYAFDYGSLDHSQLWWFDLYRAD